MTTETEKLHREKRSQAGVTLMEMIAALAIIAIIIIGSLALYNAATSSQSSTQLVQDMTSVRAAVRQLWLGQGQYGIAAGTPLNATLIASNKLPNTLRVNGAVLTHVLNGQLTVTGFPAQFTIAVTNISADVCLTLLTNTTGWTQIQVGAAAPIVALPINPAAAAAACGGVTNTITFTSL